MTETSQPPAISGRRRLLNRFLGSRTGILGLSVVAFYLLIAAFGPLIAHWDPDELDLMNVAMPPSAAHLMGTDQFGRDTLSRVIYGARTSLLLGFCVVGAASIVGTFLGALAGYYQGSLLERGLMALTDVIMTMPSIVTALAIITIMGSGLYPTIIAISIASTPSMIRVARGAVLQVRGLDYIQSSRAIGAPDGFIIRRHVIPNALAPIIVQASLLMAEAVLIAAGLGFLGLGVAPPLAEWGQMLAEGRGYLRSAPFVSVFPGLAIIILVLGLNLLGDGLRDTFDVRTKQEIRK